MITVLDTQPQEWMTGNALYFHTIAACCFRDEEHAEYWISKLIPKNQQSLHLKWSSGRSKKHRTDFIERCLTEKNIDFSVYCISSLESDMSWFAYALYLQNMELIHQQLDLKGRNNLVFKINDETSISIPVLRAGHLIWYSQVILMLEKHFGIHGELLSDNFANDEVGPGEGKAQGTAFVNFLLEQYHSSIRISLPTTERYYNLDKLSDYFCGWINSVRNVDTCYSENFETIEKALPFLQALIFKPDFHYTDEHGEDITDNIVKRIIGESTQ